VEQGTGFGNIDSFIDVDSGETNGRATPGGIDLKEPRTITIGFSVYAPSH
jgi:hypothetical protein